MQICVINTLTRVAQRWGPHLMHLTSLDRLWFICARLCPVPIFGFRTYCCGRPIPHCLASILYSCHGLDGAGRTHPLIRPGPTFTFLPLLSLAPSHIRGLPEAQFAAPWWSKFQPRQCQSRLCSKLATSLQQTSLLALDRLVPRLLALRLVTISSVWLAIF